MRRIGLFISTLVLATTTLAHAQSGSESAPVGGAGAPATDPKKKPAADDEGEEVAVEEEGPRPDSKSGVLSAKVIDAETKEDIIDGQCSIVGTKHKAITDADGTFSLKLEPGTYSVRCFFEGYKTARIDNVTIVAGQKATIKVSLDPDKAKQEADEVVVEVDPDRSTTATQFVLRKNSANVSDAVSAADIAKTPDRNAAEATRRVVGATVVGGRFVFVRGLGDRYTNSLLNGTPLPSPEPDLQAIPLDIFPVAVLSDVTILKTFTPDMPADFAGGSVRVQTKSFPSEFFTTITSTIGFNTLTTFKPRFTYQGSDNDWLASDGGARRIPRLIARSGKLEGTNEEMEAYGESLNQKGRRIYTAPAGPNYALSATAGDTKNVFGNPLGWVVALNYGRRWLSRGESQAAYNFVDPIFSFNGTRDVEVNTLGGLTTVGYQFGKNHRLSFTGLYSATGEDEVLQFEGLEQDDRTTQRVRRTRWVQRSLTFGQLIGEHKFPALGNAFVKWNAFQGVAKRGEPNNTQSVYQLGGDGKYGAVNDDGFTHFFSQQKETLRGVGLDWTQPIGKSLDPKTPDDAPKLKFGGLITAKDRKFDARRFRFQRLRTPGVVEWLQSDPAEALTDDSIGKFAVIEENTRSTDSYKANQGIYAAYLMVDLPVTSRFRVIGGERIEHTKLEVITRNDLELGNPELKGGFTKTDLLPGINAVYKLLDNMNARFAASQTVARPQFREVAPFVYQDFFNGALIYGNEKLQRTLITNLDLRWEWFPSQDEVIAASVFYKHFKDPIESALVQVTSQYARTFKNADSARNFGVELEGRKRFSFVPKELGVYTFIGNISIIDSKVRLTEDQKVLVTTLERPLQGQAPWVLNLALDWGLDKTKTRARISYNVAGSRIDAMGTRTNENDALPDIYELPRHQVDLAVSQTVTKTIDVKLAVENLLNSPYRFEQGKKGDTPANSNVSFPATTSRWRTGQTIWLSLIYNL